MNQEKPGQFPYTRGIHASGYNDERGGKLWTFRLYAGFDDARATNTRYRRLLQEGVTGLSMAFDLPTQLGFNADHDLALGEVGKVGVSIQSIEDMDLIFDDIDQS